MTSVRAPRRRCSTQTDVSKSTLIQLLPEGLEIGESAARLSHRALDVIHEGDLHHAPDNRLRLRLGVEDLLDPADQIRRQIVGLLHGGGAARHTYDLSERTYAS